MTSRGLQGQGPLAPHLLPPLVSLWRVVVVVVVCWTVVPPVSGSGHLILWGRCYSFCLHTHLQQRSYGGGEMDTLPTHPIRVCQRHQACRWCLYVCERPEDTFTNFTSCDRDCWHTRTRAGSRGRKACTQACHFLQRAGHAKGGTCPAPGSLQGFQSACVSSCSEDAACGRAAEKCCSNECGKVCTEPQDVHILPPVPGNLRFRMLKTGGVLIAWEPAGSRGVHHPPARRQGGSSRDSGEQRSGGDREEEEEEEKGTQPEQSPPAVFIFRWWCPYTSGAVTSVTDRARTRVQGYPAGIYPGSKCHFMVSAVNQHGSRGFSKVSPYIKQFLLPSPPLHLEKVKSRVHDGKVDVTIRWQPPVYTDGLPVFRYQVFWSDSLPRASASYMRLHMHKRVLSANQHSFVLQSLNMGTIYFVQVRAVVRWKKRQKVGKPASTYIETYAPPQPASGEESEERGGGGRGRGGSVIDSVKVNQTFYDHTVLKTHLTWTLKPGKNARKYLIYWKAESCVHNPHRKSHSRSEISATSHASSFTLYNLQPQCEYAVRVHAVRSRGRTGEATVTSFLTPSCHLIPVRQGQGPDCQTSETPEEIQGLHAETSDCVTVVRWLPPSSPSPLLQSYDVMWGRTEGGGGGFSAATVIYTSPPRQLTVPANTTSAELGRLRPGDHYTVQVRGVTEGGTGPPALLPLHVPHPDLPCSSSSSLSSSSVLDKDSPHVPAPSPGNTILTSLPTTTDVTAPTPSDVDNTTSPSPKPVSTDLHISVDVTHPADVTDDEDEVNFSGDLTEDEDEEHFSGDVTNDEVHLSGDVTDDEDKVYFSGDGVGEGGGEGETGKERDLAVMSPQTDAPSRIPSSDSRGSGGHAGPGTAQTLSTLTDFNTTPAPSSGVSIKNGGGLCARTCWVTVLTCVLMSVSVCVSRCLFLPKSSSV